MNLTPGEKLIIMMLADLNRHLKTGRGDIDAEFVSKAIAYDHTWALDWEYSSLLGTGDYKNPPHVTETVDYLDMWSFLEEGAKGLDATERADLAKASPHWGKDVRVPGFDGNDAGGHFHVAQFLVEEMDRWQGFKGRDLNSHHQVLDEYRAMFAVFKDIRPNVIGRKMTLDEMKRVLSRA
jgi:uncharacterized protein YfbU (UPF0304 family)